MNQQQLKDIINHHYGDLSTYLKKCKENLDIEDIHQFRVAYKKLRAFLRMLSHQHPNARKFKISKKIKKFFNIAGEIRDLQLQQQRIQVAARPLKKKPTVYLDLLQQQIEKLKPALDESFMKTAIGKSKPKKSSAIPRRFQLKHFRHFVNQKWKTIHAILLTRQLRDDQIHSIRKNLKDLFYNLKAFSGVNEKRLSNFCLEGKGEEDIDKIITELGNYQDQCIAISLLKSNQLKGLSSPERELLEAIKIQWTKEKRSVKQLLVKKLKTWVAISPVKK